MKWKLNKLIELNNKLNKASHLPGRDLNYTIEMDLLKFKPTIDLLAKQEKEIGDILTDFNADVKKAQVEFSTVDGSVKTKDIMQNGVMVNVYDIPEENIAGLNKKILELQEEHKDKIAEQKKAIEEYQIMLLEKDSDDIELSKVKLHNIPESISGADMKLIFDIIQTKE